MGTKTCLQRIKRGTCWEHVRRPHAVPQSSDTGYAECRHCGASIYVGRGALSPEAAQRREYLAARADKVRR